MAAPPLTEPAALPQQRNSLAENMPGEGQGKASASELPCCGYLPLCSSAAPLLKQRARRPSSSTFQGVDLASELAHLSLKGVKCPLPLCQLAPLPTDLVL